MPSAASFPIVSPRQHMHVVQVSRDGDLLRLPHDSEPVQRQLDYARELAARAPGSSITILVLSTNPGSWQQQNVRVIGLPANALTALELPRTLHALHRAKPISVITTQVPYDEAWLALAMGRVCRIPVIAQVHSDLFADAPRAGLMRRVYNAAHRWTTRRMLNAFAAVRTVSSANRAAIGRVARHRHSATIPVPVPMVSTGRSMAARLSVKEPLVLFVGRLAREKDLLTWLEVAREVSASQPAARFVLVGEGPERARLEQAVTRFGLSDVVTFAGFLPNNELPNVYAKATAILLTSPSEGFARVLVEAASQGTAAVSTISAGPRDIVINGVTGFLHDTGDVTGLAHSLVTLLADPARAAMMGAQARAFVSVKFDPRRLRSEWVDLWLETARQAHRS